MKGGGREYIIKYSARDMRMQIEYADLTVSGTHFH